MTDPAPRERQVTFPSAGLTLVGTLTVPEMHIGTAPAVLLLPGSGETDRNDDAKRLAINAFPPLVRALDVLGVATFRYDKRGVGASQGDYWRTGFHDRLTDAVAAVEWLRGRPEVDPSRVFILGHSEGALIATRLAAGAGPVAGIVLLAGAAKTGEQILRWQGQQIAASLTGFPRLVLKLLHIDPLRSQDKAIARVKASTADTLRVQLVHKLNAKWMREFIAYDPAPDLAKVHVPVLAITGTKDIQIDPADLDRMETLVPGPFQGHRLPDLTHLLRAEAGPPSLRTYKQQVGRDVDPRVIDLVGTWLKGHIDGAAE
jgi:pimeloyl-ACP methyl ester carboxylesterase